VQAEGDQKRRERASEELEQSDCCRRAEEARLTGELVG
jgi:hypothetical protein